MIELHFLRPWGFLFLIPAFLFCKSRSYSTWVASIDAHLMPCVFVKKTVAKQIVFSFFLFFVCCNAVLAFVGVSYQKKDSVLYEPLSPIVIALDLSLSMRVNDVAPNRLSQAVFKTYDLLKQIKGMPTGLIVFSDEPYSIIPLTSDTLVIESILPLISFNLMPSQGTRIDRALENAWELMKETGAMYGDIFLITDGGENTLEIQQKTIDLAKKIASKKGRLFILGVGSKTGGYLTDKEEVPLLDALGNKVNHQLKELYLKELALAGGGAYTSVALDNTDVAFLIETQKKIFIQSKEKKDIRNETRQDFGYWFLILPALWFPFLFRSNKLLLLLMFFATPARAGFVENWFYSEPAKALFLIHQDENKALEIVQKSKNFVTVYNVGTQLLLNEKYDQSVLVLTKAVEMQPDNEDARINLEIAKILAKKPPLPPPPPPENKPDSDNLDAPEVNKNQGQDSGGGQGTDPLNESKKESDKNDTQELEASTNNAPENNGAGGRGLPRVDDDPSLLLKRKIMFLYLNKRYPQEDFKGASW